MRERPEFLFENKGKVCFIYILSSCIKRVLAKGQQKCVKEKKKKKKKKKKYIYIYRLGSVSLIYNILNVFYDQ